MKGMAKSWETFNRSSEYQSALNAKVESFSWGPFVWLESQQFQQTSADGCNNQIQRLTHKQCFWAPVNTMNRLTSPPEPVAATFYVTALVPGPPPRSHMFENLDKLMWHNESEHVKRDERVHGNLAQHVYHSTAFSRPQSKPKLWGRGLSDIRQTVSRPSSDPKTRVPVPDEKHNEFSFRTVRIWKKKKDITVVLHHHVQIEYPKANETNK